LFVAMLFAAGDASAARIKVLYNFIGGQDGSGPNGGVIDLGGSLFGVTVIGGSGLYGTVFKFDRSTGSETILHGFQGGTDGLYPMGGLVYANGYLYGVTEEGGSDCSCGTVFAVDAKTGAETVLHSFQGDADGLLPEGSVIYRDGALYGTTTMGGADGFGAIFKVDVATGAETVLYSFTNGADGLSPAANLIFVKGFLYGSTGAAIFRLNPVTGAFKVVLSLEGSALSGPTPLMYEGGKLYGTSSQGGQLGYGAVFAIDLPSGVETTLYDFQAGNDGYMPSSGVIYQNGLLYGETGFGGVGQEGVVYSVNPDTGNEKVICTFNGNKRLLFQWWPVFQTGCFEGSDILRHGGRGWQGPGGDNISNRSGLQGEALLLR
jgi:uncharacterized repeat protein (TIGR03803 family)